MNFVASATSNRIVMKVNFKVSFYLRSNYVTKEGKTPIMMRIFLDGKMLNLGSAGFSVEKKFWNTPTSRAIGRSSEVNNLNASLDMISSHLQEIFRNMQREGNVSLERIKSVYWGKNKNPLTTSMLQFFETYLENVKAEVGFGKSKALYQKYTAACRHFSEFLTFKYARKDLSFTELTPAIIDDFFVYLKTVSGMKPNSATRTLKFFKTMIIYARKRDILNHDPFVNHSFHMEPVDRGFLTDEELRLIMQKEFDIPRLDIVRDLFIFSCFCGLAYIDMSQLTPDNIVTLDGKQWIMTKRQKTRIPSNIPLLEIPQLIIEKYRGHTKNGLLLPTISNQKANAYLKEIADVCGIRKRLSYHMARHTFATMSLSKGVPIESVSKMLGHTNIKTTQIYARITNKKIEEDMRHAADKFNGFADYFKA